MNEQQTQLWNGPSGRAWIDAQEVLDQAFRPFQDLLTAEVTAVAPSAVLDVGCGTGSTTIAAARALGGKGRSVGVDLSEPMLAVARARAAREGAPATFIAADAQTHAFAPAGFDLLLSRFGVMFFEDPVRAFANLRRATRPGGELRFIAWRSPADNPFMTTAERAAAPLLPNLPARQPDGPGQFAFADPARVQGLLGQSGWNDIDLQKVDPLCTFPAQDLLRYVTRLGPVGQALQTADDETRTRVIEALRAAFQPYVHGAEIRFNGACWMLRARAA